MGNNPSQKTMRIFFAFFFMAVLAFTPQQGVQAAGNRYYVRGNGGNDSNNGASWNQAFKNLQRALSSASAGDEIWVAKGVYYPDNGGIYPLDSRSANFTLPNAVKIFGGFAGTESSLSARNTAANPTILSGDVDNNDTNADGNFIAETTSAITGANAFHVVVTSGVNSATVLDGFTITAGQADVNTDPDRDGAGLYNQLGSPTLRNLTFQGNYAIVGGGMFNLDGAPSLENVQFTNNFAVNYGGGLWNQGESSLSGGSFRGNVAGTAGGGMMNYGTSTKGGPSLTQTTFIQNQAPTGGGIANDTSNINLDHVTFDGNYASVRGGGMASLGACVPSLSAVVFTDNSSISGGGLYTAAGSDAGLVMVDFSGNQANHGAGMYNDSSSPALYGGTFNANISAGTGGGMQNQNGSTPGVEMVTFQNNQAVTGGGMYNYQSSPSLKNVDFVNNQSVSNSTGGGGIYNHSSSPTLNRVNFTGNKANSSAGGGMYNYDGSSPALTDVNFTGNSASNGGGMRNHFNNNQPVLTNVTFHGNEAQYGGGVSNDSSTPTFYNATFAGNFANQGGGMMNYQSSPVVWNSTFYGNTTQGADQGGGMYNVNNSEPFLRNVILAGNTNGDCINGAGGTIAGWYTLIQDSGARACGAVNGDAGFLVGVDPELEPLDDNGGFTLTFQPHAGSPVIDAVIDNWCMTTTDQRGFERFIDGDHNVTAICDIGAVESGFQSFLPSVLR